MCLLNIFLGSAKASRHGTQRIAFVRSTNLFKGISINLHFDWITNLTSQLIEFHRLGCFPAYVKPRISISNEFDGKKKSINLYYELPIRFEPQLLCAQHNKSCLLSRCNAISNCTKVNQVIWYDALQFRYLDAV